MWKFLLKPTGCWLKIPGLKVVEGGFINLTGIYSDEIDLRPVSKALIDQEWMLVFDQSPAPITLVICTMPQNDGQIKEFLKALAESVEKDAVPIGEFADETVFDLYGNLDLSI